MTHSREVDYIKIAKRDWRKASVVFLGVLIIGLVLTFIQPFLYGSSVSILVLQKSSFSIDAYSASKSEERMAGKLAQVVYSSSFLDKVLTANLNIDRDYFPRDELKRREKWQDTIESNVPSGLGKLEITAYHIDPKQALIISQTVGDVLILQKAEFVGINDVDLKILDEALVSKYPEKPNVLMNIVIIIAVGIVLAFAVVVLTYNPERRPWLKRGPRLINYANVPTDDSVEEEMAEEKEEFGGIPEVELEDLEEDATNNPANGVPSTRDELATNSTNHLGDEGQEEELLPDISEEIKEEQREEQGKEQEEQEKKEEVKAKEYGDLPEFGNEDKIVRMPKEEEK
jgi:capsular polysaccharide biosynthesis protein